MFQQLKNPFILLIGIACNFIASIKGDQFCTSFSCGSNGVNFSYPFWLIDKSPKEFCGYPDLGINCSNGNPILSLAYADYLVRSINYSSRSLRVVNTQYVGQTCPQPQIIHENPSTGSLYSSQKNERYLYYFSKCSPNPPPSVPYLPCQGSNPANHSYVFEEDAVPDVYSWDSKCKYSYSIPVHRAAPNLSNNGSNYGSILEFGTELKWDAIRECFGCEKDHYQCVFSFDVSIYACYCISSNNRIESRCPDPDMNHGSILELGTEMEWHTNLGTELTPSPEPTPSTEPMPSPEPTSHRFFVDESKRSAGFLVLIILGVLAVTVALVTLIVYRRRISSKCSLMFCRWSTKNRKNFNVEAFLENYGHGPLAICRHTYSNLRKITNGFKDKLGQGGYGSVFKGKLMDGRLVAVKVLTENKGNGEDFINEVTAISRTNHVNIVSLIGFCFERSKRALVYEYMPNGSLEKFLYNEKNPNSTHTLGGEKLHQIALGIANGLEYLHCGCTTRILHFDIKPHNILLDKDFCPKISDFGLAKLCPTRKSTVSMLNARGTIGYIAPEVSCRNFGGVSSKSDVYSYGMMVLEMVGGRKNIDPTAKTSEIYFPQWIYNRLEQHGSVGLGEIDDAFEEESIRKMMIVGLWCIQTHPATRPSMSMVVEMLQKSVEDLQMPPNPFQDPPTCTVENLLKLSNSVQDTLTSTSSQPNL